jgi:hypothetical protein
MNKAEQRLASSRKAYLRRQEEMSVCNASAPVSSVPSERRRVAYVQTSEAVREEPLVSVLVPFVQTSAARVPNVVRDLVVADQTAVGIVEASEVEAVKTVELVLLLIVVIAEEI